MRWAFRGKDTAVGGKVHGSAPSFVEEGGGKSNPVGDCDGSVVGESVVAAQPTILEPEITGVGGADARGSAISPATMRLVTDPMGDTGLEPVTSRVSCAQAATEIVQNPTDFARFYQGTRPLQRRA